MTNKEKLDAILDRMKEQGKDILPEHISAMVIVGYLNDLAEIGLVQTAFTMTPVGKSVRAICDEFDWTPTDEDIRAFVIDMVAETERPAFAYMVTKYRDDKQGLINDFDTFKKTQMPGSV
jgi:hypothetical protein